MFSKFLETFSRPVQVAWPLHSKESKGRKLLRQNKEPRWQNFKSKQARKAHEKTLLEKYLNYASPSLKSCIHQERS